ncbi:hypothetical protein [Desulfosporosinus sp. OT]|nr:hypothetical protein [Desulfosporosinus sp. OT]EGW41857.1 hypothetical protein DOT_0156 [Desulfosporosinus sp. OT]
MPDQGTDVVNGCTKQVIAAIQTACLLKFGFESEFELQLIPRYDGAGDK